MKVYQLLENWKGTGMKSTGKVFATKQGVINYINRNYTVGVFNELDCGSMSFTDSYGDEVLAIIALDIIEDGEQ